MNPIIQAAANAKDNELMTEGLSGTAEEREVIALQRAIAMVDFYAEEYGVDRNSLLRYLQGYRDMAELSER